MNRFLRTEFSVVLVIALFSCTVIRAELEDGELTGAIGTPALASGEKPRFDLVVYVNGQNTKSGDAKRDAGLIAARINCGVHLIYNDLTLPVVDWFSTLIEKAGDADCSVNAATKTLISLMQQQIEKGQSIHVIGHSAGSLCIHNAVKAVAQGYKSKSQSERESLLSRVHVLTVGGATFSKENIFADGWPRLGSIHHLRDSRDGVANVWGEGDFWDWFDCDMGDHHSMAGHYVKQIALPMLSTSGTTVTGE